MPSSADYAGYINGFTVHSETRDDALQWDEKRDEVYIAAKVIVMDKERKTFLENEPISTIMGDTNNLPGRAQAGSWGLSNGRQLSYIVTVMLDRNLLDMRRYHPPMMIFKVC